MDNTIELQALRQSIQQFSGDVANLVFQRNVAQAQSGQLQTALTETQAELTKVKTDNEQLTNQVDDLNQQLADARDDLAGAESEIRHLDEKLDAATRYMNAENALAFVSGADPVPEQASGR